jgi:hypothetical protein
VEVHDEMPTFFLRVNKDFLRDILLDYYHGTQVREAVVQAICKNFKIDALDIVEILGAVDELKANKKDETDF